MIVEFSTRFCSATCSNVLYPDFADPSKHRRGRIPAFSRRGRAQPPGSVAARIRMTCPCKDRACAPRGARRRRAPRKSGPQSGFRRRCEAFRGPDVSGRSVARPLPGREASFRAARTLRSSPSGGRPCLVPAPGLQIPEKEGEREAETEVKHGRGYPCLEDRAGRRDEFDGLVGQFLN